MSNFDNLSAKVETKEERHANLMERINQRLNELESLYNQKVNDPIKFAKFKENIIAYLIEAKSLSKKEVTTVLKFTQKLFHLLDVLLKPEKHLISTIGIKDAIDDLKSLMPSTTFGRVCKGILTAFLIPFAAILETLALPLACSDGYQYSPYMGTRQLANYTCRMFQSPVYPLVEAIEELNVNFKENAQASFANH